MRQPSGLAAVSLIGSRAPRDFVCYYQNVRGINSKVIDFYSAVSLGEFDVLCLTETWIGDRFESSELFPDSYQVFRRDRDFDRAGRSRGGGVLLALRNSIAVVQSVTGPFALVDLICCRCLLGGCPVVIVVLYMPPNVSIDEVQDVLDFLEERLGDCDRCIVIGDFNIPHFRNDSNSTKYLVLKRFTTFMHFQQYNEIGNANDRLLDLCFANIDVQVEREDVPLLPEDAHHPALRFGFAAVIDKPNKFPASTGNRNYNFKRTNFTLLYEALNGVDWSPVLNANDIDDKLDRFYKLLYEIFDDHVPLYKKTANKYPCWYTRLIISNIKRKNRMRLVSKRRGEWYTLVYTNLRRTIKSQIHIAYRAYIKEAERQLKRNPKGFWSFIKSKRGLSRIPNCVYDAAGSYDAPADVVNAFASHFSSVFMQRAHTPVVAQCNRISNALVHIKHITELDILTACKRLNNKLTAGPDYIPSFLVKASCAALMLPLIDIFNKILKSCIFPIRWKLAKVCPIHKSGNKNDVSNYRPISILCNFSKLFEVVIYNSIFPTIRNYISTHQHGFMTNRSTTSNLAYISQYISNAINDRGQIDVIYTDFSKAFDSIDHVLLIRKLQTFGFSDSLGCLISSYLSDRQQFVTFNGFRSNFYTAASGVPQGSNIGPLLFLIFINDLPDLLGCEKLLFADDLKIFTKIKTPTDCSHLQADLLVLQKWCTQNALSLNIAKCKIVTYTLKKNAIKYNYSINNELLGRCDSVKDLGVTFDSQFSFIPHIDLTISIALKMLGFICRNCNSFTDEDALKSLYFALVRSRLDYAAIVWQPLSDCHKFALERVQRKFLKFLTFRKTGTYPPRGYDNQLLLREFSMTSLETRRGVLGVTFLHKLLNNKIDCPELFRFIRFYVPQYRARHVPMFSLPFPNLNVMLKSPFYVMCKNANLVSNECDFSSSSLSRVVEISTGIL